MIRSFADKRTAAIFAGLCPKGAPAEVANIARRKLAMIDKAIDLQDLRSPPGNRLEALKGIGRVSIAYASTINGGYAFAGPTEPPKMSNSAITIEVWRDN